MQKLNIISNSIDPRRLNCFEPCFGLKIPSFLFATLCFNLLLSLDLPRFLDGFQLLELQDEGLQK
jgi:hypothetical protein